MTGKVRWSSPEPGHAQVIAAGGKLVLFNDRGEIILAKADPEKYEELGRVSLFPDEVCWTAPALADGRLLVRTQTRAACVYLGKEPLDSVSSPISAAEIPRGARFNSGSLLGAERDFPATVPEAKEFLNWYACSLGAIGLASLASGAVKCAAWLRRRKTSPADKSPFVPPRSRLADAIFWLFVFVAGVSGSPLLHHLQSTYIFTWPLALWAAFELTLIVSFVGSKEPFWSRARGLSYLVGLAFLALCDLYFHLCRSLGLAIEWTFLTGFGWTFPLAAFAAWLSLRRWRCQFAIETAAWVASFSLYYWSSVLFVVLWLRR